MGLAKRQQAKHRRDGKRPDSPDSFTMTDNRRLDSPEFAALCKRNPRAGILLWLLDRQRYRGVQDTFKPDAKGCLALNGNLALPRKVVAPFMTKAAKTKAQADIIEAGFVEVTSPARPPDRAARLRLIDDPAKWKIISSASCRKKRARAKNGLFLRGGSDNNNGAGAPVLENRDGGRPSGTGVPRHGNDSYTGPSDGKGKRAETAGIGPADGLNDTPIGPPHGPISGHGIGKGFSQGATHA